MISQSYHFDVWYSLHLLSTRRASVTTPRRRCGWRLGGQGKKPFYAQPLPSNEHPNFFQRCRHMPILVSLTIMFPSPCNGTHYLHYQQPRPQFFLAPFHIQADNKDRPAEGRSFNGAGFFMLAAQRGVGTSWTFVRSSRTLRS